MKKIIFNGLTLAYPSGSGLSTRDCPDCDNKLYCIFGYNGRLDKFIVRDFCETYRNGCGYYKDNMTDEEREAFNAQRIIRDETT